MHPEKKKTQYSETQVKLIYSGTLTYQSNNVGAFRATSFCSIFIFMSLRYICKTRYLQGIRNEP